MGLGCCSLLLALAQSRFDCKFVGSNAVRWEATRATLGMRPEGAARQRKRTHAQAPTGESGAAKDEGFLGPAVYE